MERFLPVLIRDALLKYDFSIRYFREKCQGFILKSRSVSVAVTDSP